MRHGRMMAAALVTAWSLPAAAMARDVTVQVDAAAGPWSSAANEKEMPFGIGDAKPAVTVPFDLGGGQIAIFATGTTSVPGHEDVGPSGIENAAVNDTLMKKKRFPSFYTPKILYPANRHALVAAFVDAKGGVLGRPFVVGKGARVSVIEGAVALSFGFNDVTFAGNTGALTVTVELPD